VCKSNEEVPVTGSIFLLPLSAYWLTAACSEAVVFDEPCMWQFHSILFVILRSSPIGEVAAEMITDKMLSSQVCANALLIPLNLNFKWTLFALSCADESMSLWTISNGLDS